MSKPSGIASPTGSPFAVVVMFFGNGFVMASSYSRMPGIRDQLGSTPTQLAFALVCMGIGSILGMPFTGRLVDRYSSRKVSLVATLICLGGWAMLPIARSVPVLALMLLITGVGTGVGDVDLCEAKGEQDGKANKAQESFTEFVISSSDSPVALDSLEEVSTR